MDFLSRFGTEPLARLRRPDGSTPGGRPATADRPAASCRAVRAAGRSSGRAARRLITGSGAGALGRRGEAPHRMNARPEAKKLTRHKSAPAHSLTPAALRAILQILFTPCHTAVETSGEI